jgi:hypothetical protein
MITSKNKWLAMFSATTLFALVALLLTVLHPLNTAEAQQDDNGPEDMQELCQFIAEQDEDFGMVWVGYKNEAELYNFVSGTYSPDDIYWCGKDFMCLDEPFENDGDLCVPYTGIYEIWFDEGAFGD